MSKLLSWWLAWELTRHWRTSISELDQSNSTNSKIGFDLQVDAAFDTSEVSNSQNLVVSKWGCPAHVTIRAVWASFWFGLKVPFFNVIMVLMQRFPMVSQKVPSPKAHTWVRLSLQSKHKATKMSWCQSEVRFTWICLVTGRVRWIFLVHYSGCQSCMLNDSVSEPKLQDIRTLPDIHFVTSCRYFKQWVTVAGNMYNLLSTSKARKSSRATPSWVQIGNNNRTASCPNTWNSKLSTR